MTLEDRVAALEADNAELKALLQNVSRWVYQAEGGDVSVPNLNPNATRFSLNTGFWSNLKLGQGATMSIGGADRFALYAETDEIRCHDKPSTAIYGAVTQPNPFMMNNIGVHGVANNGVVNYGIFCTSGDRSMGLRREGFELVNGPGVWDRVLIGPAGGPYVQLWPILRVWP